MASSDLYYNSSKEKDRLMKNNIRSRAGSGGLNSNESQYSNYLQNLKPKDKKENNQKNHHNNDIHSSSFVESAARASSINSRKDVNKTKSDPTPHKKSKPTPVQQQKTEESEATVVDVGKLRSFFDRAADENNPSISNVPRRPGSRPNSFSFDDNKIKNFDINKFLRKDDEDVKSSNKTDESSEFLTFEDNVVPTGSKTIDINSILVASPSQAEEKKISKTEEKETNKIKTAKEPAKNELSFEKRLQLERIKRAAEEQAIEQKYSFKRRSLKERLNDMLTEDERIEAEANRIQAESGITAEFYVDVEEPDTKEIVSISDTTYNVTPDNVPETNNTYTVAKEEISLPNNATYNVESDSTYTLEENDASNLLRKTDFEETFVVKHAEETFSENIVSERKNEIDDSDTETLVLDSEDANGLLYKSALERFEEFIHQEEQKPVILSPTTEKNLEEVEEFVKNNKYKDEVKDSASEASGEESDTDLMNSILKHMETSTDIEKDDIKKFNGEQGDLSNSNIADVSAVTDSKLEESEVNATAETTTETELAADDKDTTNHDLTMTHHDDTTSSHITTDDSDEESSENEYTIEHFLDPPAKSNLAGAERKPKRNVIFNDNKLTETILTYGPSEYDRANADIDPIASSAEWELEKRVDKMDIFSVDLQKDGKGLGLSIIGLGVGTETGVEKLGIFVKTLTDGGASQKDGRIQVNDQILEVNGISLVGVTQSFAAQTLKGTSGVVRFLMGREKSRRTQFAPGSALADNPEVQQHMEEMRQALQQLEEFEDRALNAESTVEEIKQELLKAEERAHGAEQALAETKDKLSAVKESPFTNNRKLKNEIKSKKGSKGSDAKVDELQKNLKDVTSRLSVSEDNLLQLSSEYGSKEKQLDHLQQEVATNSQIVEELENANRKLKDGLAGKQGKVEAATKQTENLQNELNELKGKIEKERKAFKDQADLFNEQSDSVQKLFEQKYSELEKKNQSLEDELEILKRREQEANKSREEIQRSLEKLQSETDKLKAADETGALKTAVDTKENDIKKLWEENDKLRISNNLIKTNLDELSSQHRQLELLNEKEKQAGEEERQQLNSKIIELEAKLKETELYRNIQVANQVQVESPPTDSFELPEVITIRKSTAEPSTGEDLDKSSAESEVSLPPVEIKRPEESSVEKINPHRVFLVEPESSPKVSLDTSAVLPEVALESKQDIASDNDLTHDNTEVVSTKLPVDRPTIEESIIGLPETSVDVECAPTIETITDQNMTSSKEKIKIDTNSNEVISNEDPIDEKLSEIKSAEISATQPLPEAEAKSSLLDEINVAVLSRGESMTVTTKRLSAQEFDSLSEANIDNVSGEDPLSEDTTGDVPQASVVKNLSKVENAEKPSNDSSVDGAADLKRLSRALKEEDEGQFSIIAEQVEEEPEEKRMVQLQEQQKLSIDLAIGELKQLDSFDKDEKAEEIAAQVISESPTKKRHTSYGSSDEEYDAPQPMDVSGMSSTSTLLSDNMDRKASVKIDAHYFQKSPPAEITDVEVSILDDEEENADDREDLSRNDSFSVIPYTVVLDNQYSAHKRDVKSPKRRPPTKGTAGKLAENIDEFQLDRSVDDIPVDSAKLQQQSQAAVSLPNLISPATHNHVEKEKQSKSKFSFHIPKVFKKNKGSSVSHENLVSQSPSAASTPIDPPPTLAESHSEDAILHSENNNSEVVPLSEKLEYHAQQQANDAATEEAVVPFAQMVETNGPAMTTPSSSSKDNFKLELQASLASKLKQETFNERAVNAVNERPVDIGEAPPSTNVEQPPPAEVMQKEIIDWDIRQVGIWLVETNMSQYVEGFKSHKVDGHTLINADGNTLKEYGVTNHEHRAEIKKRVKELKNRMTKASFNKGKARTSKGKLSFWKGKYKVAN